jgi:hypothetical protein
MSIASAIIAVVGIGVSAKGQSDARREQKEGRAVQSAAQLNEDIAAQRRSAREERIKRAQILQAAEGTGASGSSKQVGAISSLTQQAAANISRQGGQQLASEGISKVNQNIADAQTLQAFGGALKQVGGSAFKATGGFDNLFN